MATGYDCLPELTGVAQSTQRGEMTATPARPGTPASRTPRFWRTRLAVRRAGVQWQLLAVVTAIAILASTLITSLTLLVSATELGAVRGALAESTSQPAELRVLLTRPDQPLDGPRERVEAALATVLGDAATSTSTGAAQSELQWVAGEDGVNRLIYLGDYERISENTTLVSGDWPMEGDVTEVALPENGAAVLGLAAGDSFTTTGTRSVPGIKLTVSGLYRIEAPDPAFWGSDRLDGTGHVAGFMVPGSGGSIRTDAVGPLIVASGVLDSAEIPVERFTVRLTPDFSKVTVDSLDRLAVRLSDAVATTAPRIGDVAKGVDYSSGLDSVVRSITSAMAVTRSTVVAVSLLLFVLAIAALGQAARLLTEARVGERHLMRARGSSSRQILGLAAVEAALIAAVAAVLSPILAQLVYLFVSNQPAMVESGMPASPGLPPIVIGVAALTAVLFGLVLVAPLVRREGSFHEGEQGNARQQRFSGLQRSGVDVALIAIAGVAYWQLLSYQGSSTGTQLGVDPVLAAGPVLIMLAGALIAVRLVPTVARVTERIAERSRGAVVSLAAWEVGRRAQRATAAILLLTLALAVGTFSHAFLATWRQSQLDQAAFALGAPLRITAEPDDPGVPLDAAPVIRAEGVVAGPDETVTFLGDPDGEPASIIGVAAEGREFMAQGRLGEIGGAEVQRSIETAPPIEQAIELPDRTTGLSATIRVVPDFDVPDLQADLTVLVQDELGVKSIIDLGRVNADGGENQVTGLMPDGKGHNGLEIIAYQVSASIKNPLLYGSTVQTPVRLLVRDLSAIGIAPSTTPVEEIPTKPITIGDISDWRASGELDDTIAYPKEIEQKGWQLGFSFTIPEELDSRSANYVHTAWSIIGDVDAVITESLAKSLRAESGERFTIVVSGVTVPIFVKAIAPAVPGTSASLDFGPLGGGPTGAESVVVLDEESLARLLFQKGVPSLPHEWWAGITPDEQDAYMKKLGVSAPTLSVTSAYELGLAMQQHPVRVATQAALWLVIAGAIALATAGFAVHATGSLRSRATEFAQLRAVGLTRQRLVGIIGIESLLLCVLGVLFGVGLGLVLAWLVAPLVGVSADGSNPIPSVEIIVPAPDILLMIGLLGIVLAAVVLVAARAQRVAEPATALRQGEER